MIALFSDINIKVNTLIKVAFLPPYICIHASKHIKTQICLYNRSHLLPPPCKNMPDLVPPILCHTSPKLAALVGLVHLSSSH